MPVSSERLGSVCLALTSLVACLGSFAAPQLAAQDSPPNIVLLIADDLGYGELGCQGNPQIPTPHIDSLAESGMRCTQAYVTAPNCSPSRAGLLTGRTPTRFGYEFNPIGARNDDLRTGLPTSEVTLAEHLHAAGYTTGLIGKWHLGGASDYHPQRHGFDEFFGFLHEGHFYRPPPWDETVSMLRRKTLPPISGTTGNRHRVSANLWYTNHMGHDEPIYDANNPILRGGTPIVEPEYLTDAITREAQSFLKRYQDVPFCLTIAYNAVHSPLQSTRSSFNRFSHIEDEHRRIFAGMLASLDASVGGILATLDETGCSERTLVIFLSDNGGPTRELTSSNAPLRGEKGSMYEGGLRVPMLVRYPGKVPAGGVCEAVVSSLDIFPTCAKLSGGGLPDWLEGQDLIPLFNSKSQPTSADRPPLFWRQGGRAALRHGPWKIVSPGRDATQPRWELYNIEQDISESRNLTRVHPKVLQDLVERWQTLDAEMAAPLF